MNTKEFFAALELLEKEKGISKDIIIEAFEHALISAYKKNFNQATNVKVEIDNTSFDDIGTVDEKLLALSMKIYAAIITTDFNLMKVAEIQNIKVLNLNNLAIALRQTILPGEDLIITIAKEGKDPSQGVGYLDDGTMVVAENGKKRLGETLKVEATSLLQTESGRIIFTKVKA